MNVVNNNNQTTSNNISAKDLLEAYVSKMTTVEGRIEALETRLENSIQSIDANMRQDATFDNDNFREVRKEIRDIKKDLSDFHKEITSIDKAVTGNLHEIEIDSKDADSEQLQKLKDLEIRMLGIGAGSGTVTTIILQIILEIAKSMMHVVS